LSGRRLLATVVLVAVVVTLPVRARAFTIASAVSSACHETITRQAFLDVVADKGIFRDPAELQFVQGDPVWLEVARYLEEQLGLTAPDDRARLVLITLFVGVRHPDQQGFAIYDIQNLRDIHLDADDQKSHALRAPWHDHDHGSALAVADTRQHILDRVDMARAASLRGNIMDETTEVSFWIEFYGSVDVLVWEPLFHLGAAAHTLQDSFTHSYRSADTREIYAVANFIEGLDSDHEEGVEGPRHSDFLDACEKSAVEPLRTSATAATSELFLASAKYIQDETQRGEVEAVLDRWLSYQEGCGFDENYCDTPWADLAKRDETTALFGCAAMPARPSRLDVGSGAGAGGGGQLVALLALGWIARRRRVSKIGRQ